MRWLTQCTASSVREALSDVLIIGYFAAHEKPSRLELDSITHRIKAHTRG